MSRDGSTLWLLLRRATGVPHNESRRKHLYTSMLGWPLLRRTVLQREFPREFFLEARIDLFRPMVLISTDMSVGTLDQLRPLHESLSQIHSDSRARFRAAGRSSQTLLLGPSLPQSSALSLFLYPQRLAGLGRLPPVLVT